jgi:hypothetical protein
MVALGSHDNCSGKESHVTLQQRLVTVGVISEPSPPVLRWARILVGGMHFRNMPSFQKESRRRSRKKLCANELVVVSIYQFEAKAMSVIDVTQIDQLLTKTPTASSGFQFGLQGSGPFLDSQLDGSHPCRGKQGWEPLMWSSEKTEAGPAGSILLKAGFRTNWEGSCCTARRRRSQCSVRQQSVIWNRRTNPFRSH